LSVSPAIVYSEKLLPVAATSLRAMLELISKPLGFAQMEGILRLRFCSAAQSKIFAQYDKPRDVEKCRC
jgi:hypothetical protein